MINAPQPFYFNADGMHVKTEQYHFLGLSIYTIPFLGYRMTTVTDDFGQAVQVDQHIPTILLHTAG